MSQTTLTCGKCGIVFSAPTRWVEERQEKADTFYCPNGHPRAFRESTTDKLQREVNWLKQQQARIEEEARQARADAQAARMREGKAVKERDRIRKRVQGGACPDCNRTFTDLARHMATKHPQRAAALSCTAEGHA